eukprot:m.69385 g.69385  ORF g.69385 m.69385 type:complete len:547 (+) comp19981_c0_seq1:147-1787(+)
MGNPSSTLSRCSLDHQSPYVVAAGLVGNLLAKPVATPKAKRTPGYDLVINLPLNRLAPDKRTNSWQINLENVHQSVLDEFKGWLVSVIGQFDRGKTFFCKKLLDLDEEIQEGYDKHTTGLSISFGNLSTRINSSDQFEREQIGVIDIEGMNSPLSLTIDWALQQQRAQQNDNDNSRETISLDTETNVTSALELSKAQDILYRDLAMGLSDFVFVVLNELTRADFDLCQGVSNSLARINQNQPQKKKLYIVHNLQHVKTPKQLLKQWENIQRHFPAKRKREPSLKEIGGEHGTEDIICTAKMHNDLGFIQARHVTLVHETEGWGKKYNQASIKELRSQLLSFLTDDKEDTTDWKDFKFFEACGSQLLKRTLTNCNGISIRQHEDNPRLHDIVVNETHEKAEIAWNPSAPYDAGTAPGKVHVPFSAFTAKKEQNDNQKYFVVDFNITGCDPATVELKEKHEEDELKDVRYLVVSGELGHNTAGYSSIQKLKAGEDHPEGRFEETIAVPPRTKLGSAVKSTVAGGFFRLEFEIESESLPADINIMQPAS